MFALCLLCPEEAVDALSEALLELGALSVAVQDAQAHTGEESPLYGEPGMPVTRTAWQRSLLEALFDNQASALGAGLHLQGQDLFAGCVLQGIEAVPDCDWVRLTQAQFAPLAVTPGFWIVPSWHDAPAQARQVLRLDPGLAFGTGTHPTTYMCLRWLAQQQTGRDAQRPLGRVLDYGCGSGILAIAAAMLGANAVDAVDIDPTAVQATRDNAAANAVALRAGPPEMAGPMAQGYDTVLANILATPLKLLAPLLCGHKAPGGRIVLSGILQRQSAELQAAYAPWVSLQVVDTQDGWVLLAAQ